MEPTEALRRVVLGHRRVIAVCMLVPALLVAARAMAQPERYAATTRIAVSQNDVRSAIEAQAVASRARALATSRAGITAALAQAGLTRTPESVTRAMTLTSLGTSPVVELTVTDSRPEAAAALADALADQLVKQIDTAERGDVPAVLTSIDAQLAARIKARDALERQARSSNRTTAAAAQDGLDRIGREISDLTAQRSELAVADAQRLRPYVVDKAIVPTFPLPRTTVSDAGLALLLGLVLGVGIAGVLELLRPTIAGGRALARAAGLPLLGSTATMQQTAARLVSVARGRRVTNLQLVGTTDDEGRAGVAGLRTAVASLADERELVGLPMTEVSLRSDRAGATVISLPDAATAGGDTRRAATGWVPYAESSGAPGQLAVVHRPVATLRPAAGPGAPGTPAADQAPGSTAAVLVVPTRVRRHELDELVDLVTAAGWTPLGLVTASPTKSSTRAQPTARQRATTQTRSEES